MLFALYRCLTIFTGCRCLSFFAGCRCLSFFALHSNFSIISLCRCLGICISRLALTFFIIEDGHFITILAPVINAVDAVQVSILVKRDIAVALIVLHGEAHCLYIASVKIEGINIKESMLTVGCGINPVAYHFQYIVIPFRDSIHLLSSEHIVLGVLRGLSDQVVVCFLLAASCKCTCRKYCSKSKCKHSLKDHFSSFHNISSPSLSFF